MGKFHQLQWRISGISFSSFCWTINLQFYFSHYETRKLDPDGLTAAAAWLSDSFFLADGMVPAEVAAKTGIFTVSMLMCTFHKW